VSAPVGPTGITQECNGGGEPLGFRVGLNAGASRTTLLTDEGRLGLEQVAVTANLDWHVGRRGTLTFGAGSVLFGQLSPLDGPVHLGPGATFSVGYSHLVLMPRGAVPFVMVSGALSSTFAATQLTSYSAFDLRGGAVVGWVLWKRFSPYVGARAFGGPVFWRGMVSGDAYHFQVAAGFVLGLPKGVDVSAEVVPLGEQAISASVGYSF
jgi:hypothetical protein